MNPKGKLRLGVVGAGNIGSHAIPMLAYMAAVGEIVVIDPDLYEESNLVGQAIRRRAIGVPKAVEATARLAELRPELRAEALSIPVELVPPGRLARCDVILGCVDSLATRQYLAETCWRLGIRYLDAGVRPDSLLVRISHFYPGPDAACMQCSWDDATYRNLEQRVPCEAGNGGIRAAPTGGSAALGALAAAHLVIALDRIHEDAPGQLPPGAELIVEAGHGRCYVARNIRQRRCRFDHRRFDDMGTLDALPADVTLGDALETVRERLGVVADARLQLMNRTLVTRWVCARCGAPAERLRAWHPWAPDPSLVCHVCARPAMRPIGYHARDWLAVSEIGAADLGRTLADVGIVGGDIISARAGDTTLHLELTPKDPPGHPANLNPAHP